MIPQYVAEVQQTREPGKRVRRRRVPLDKRLARWGFFAFVLIVLAVVGGWYYALSVMALAAVGGFVDARG